ncbi:hypothetical protein BDA99DRAFT_608735 [Phascolomyces articulosus]|uniref:Uncharacterized protein n=1 Tax=Phascolomyces articulosus TaxID=60185 RepID=A0AAD5K0P7_9FUNG|nr:hypothetical protein BDA99DRAFT_608735 [Phascolomyces articulosus]
MVSKSSIKSTPSWWLSIESFFMYSFFYLQFSTANFFTSTTFFFIYPSPPISNH